MAGKSKSEGKRFHGLGWLLLVIIIPAVIYVSYVFNQQTRIDDRNIRLLGHAARQLEDVLEVTKRNVSNQLGKSRDLTSYMSLDDFLKRQPYLSPHSSSKDKKFIEVNLERILTELPLDNTINADDYFTLDHAFDYLVLANSEGCVILECTTAENESGTGLRMDSLDPLKQEIEKSEPLPEGKNGHELAGGTRCIRVQLAGRKYQVTIQPVRITCLQKSDQAGNGAPASSPPSESATGVCFVRKDTHLLIHIPAAPSREVPEEPTADIPPGLPGTNSEDLPEEEEVIPPRIGPETWVLCGLTAQDRILSQALGVAPKLGMFLVLILLVGFLGWPMIKLLLMDRRERFRFIDGFLMLVSTFALLLMVVVVLASAEIHWSLGSEAEQGLERLAARVENNFLGELGSRSNQLQAYDNHLEQWRVDSENAVEVVDGTDILPFWDNFEPCRPPFDLKPDHPFFSSVFWMNAEGMQVAKATIKRKNTPRVLLDHREYFRAVAENRLWKWRTEGADPDGDGSAGDDADRTDFFLQTYRSITTGERNAALSIASGVGTLGQDSVKAAAISGELLSVMRPVVAAGFGFAIIDENGGILFHSDGRRALGREDFFEGLNRDNRLRSAMLSRSDRHFCCSYLNQPYRMFVRPMRVTPWFLVTFHDEEVLLTAVLEVFAHTLLLGFLWMFALFVPLLLFLHLIRRRHIKWLWPDKERGPQYCLVVLLYAILLAPFGLMLLMADRAGVSGLQLTVISITLPVLSMLFTIGILFAGGRHWLGGIPDWIEKTGKDHFLFWHVAAAMGIWLMVVLAPTIGLFKAAWQDQLELLVKRDSIHFCSALEERQRRQEMEEPYHGLDLNDEFFGKLWANTWDIYPSTLLGADLSLAAVQPLSDASRLEGAWFSRWTARYKPMYSRTAWQIRYLHEERLNHGNWKWAGNRNTIRFAWDLPVGGRSFTIDYPAAGLRFQPGRVLVIGGLILLAILGLWVWYTARNIFLAGIGPDVTPCSITDVETWAGQGNLIALVSDPKTRRTLLKSNTFDKLDLKAGNRLALSGRLDELIREEDSSKDHRPVICDNFEAGMSVRQARELSLTALERLLGAGKRNIVIVTMVNPFESLLGVRAVTGEVEETSRLRGSTDPDPIPLETEEARRWRMVLSEFALAPVGVAFSSPCGTVSSVKPKMVSEQAEGTFRGLWNSCSAEEQLVLVHLAQEKMVNPKQERTIRWLLRRGLVKRDPVLDLFDEGFTEFVLHNHEPLEIARWEQNVRGIGWKQLRWAFGSLLLVLGLFIFATQPDLFNTTIGFITALGVGLPGVLKMMSNMYRSGGRGISD